MFIRNIILDMGGVIIDIDFKRTAEAFARLGVPNFYELYNQGGQESFIDDFETGKISEADFRHKLRKKFNLALTVSDQQIDEAWNALFIKLPPERLELIKGLRKRFSKVLLFSNTNLIHYEKFSSMCPDAKHGAAHDFRKPVFTGCFDEEYYSFRLGQKKPRPEAFAAILKQQGLKAAETVFIDDSIQHVIGARSAGLHAIHLDLTKGMTLMMVPQLLQDLNMRLEFLHERSLAAHRSLILDSEDDESPQPQAEIRDAPLTATLLVPQKKKSSCFSCCFPLFSSGKKKGSSQEKPDICQYPPTPSATL